MLEEQEESDAELARRLHEEEQSKQSVIVLNFSCTEMEKYWKNITHPTKTIEMFWRQQQHWKINKHLKHNRVDQIWSSKEIKV